MEEGKEKKLRGMTRVIGRGKEDGKRRVKGEGEKERREGKRKSMGEDEGERDGEREGRGWRVQGREEEGGGRGERVITPATSPCQELNYL